MPTARRGRYDEWSPTEDEILVRTVLNHIRTGGTQLSAFNEAGAKLGRTPSACGFRWNGVLRKHYQDEITEAKKHRQTQKQPATTELKPSLITTSSSDAMRDVILYLHQRDEQYHKLRIRHEELSRERHELLSRIEQLESRLAKLNEERTHTITPEQLEKDAKTVMEILARARNVVEP